MKTTFSKLVFAFICLTSVFSFQGYSQTQTVWTEDFNNGCTSGCYANTYNGSNGLWTVTSTGTNGQYFNEWFVSGAECGMLPGQCGTDCGITNSSLHISVNLTIPGFDLVDIGAAYLSGAAFVGSSSETDRRAESPDINTFGFENLQLSFSYIENGQGSIDNAEVWIFDGTTWSLLADMGKTNCCDGSGNSVPCSGVEQGLWAQFTINLPASTFNNPNFRLGFRWINNNDDIGTDPSVAIDNIIITGEPTVSSGVPVAGFTFSTSNPCVGSQVVFTDNSTNSAGATYFWDFGPNAVPSSANTVGPHTVVFTTPGVQNVTLTVTNTDGSDSFSQNVTVSPGPTINTSGNVTICNGGSTTISASGASAYEWDNGLGLGASHNVNPSVTTTYTVIGFDLAGCAGIASVTVTVDGDGPDLQISAVDALCFGTPTGQATVTATGSGPFTYNWSPAGGTNSTANSLFPGNYTVSVTDSQGCTSNASVTVGSPSQIQANGSVTNTDCNVDNGSIIVSPSGGVGPYSLVWLPGGAASPILSNLPAGAYQVTITDANNCSILENFAVGLNDDFTVTVDPPVSTIEYLEAVLLDVTVVPAIPGAIYSWSPSAGLSCIDCPNPIASPIVNTTYTVTVTATNGCSQTAQVTVNVDLPCSSAFMPTIFSPNGDGLNDELCLMGSCIVNMTFSIYNRWGELVFTSNSQTDCWDGTFRGKPAPTGVYAFKMRATLSDGTIQEESGNISLAR
jgi:gliding motility-associated-like protein